MHISLRKKRDLIDMMSSTLRLHHGRKLRCHGFLVLIVLHLIPSLGTTQHLSPFFGKALLCLLFQHPPTLAASWMSLVNLAKVSAFWRKVGVPRVQGKEICITKLGVVKLLNYPSPKICLSTSSSYTNYKVFLGSRTTWDWYSFITPPLFSISIHRST